MSEAFSKKDPIDELNEAKRVLALVRDQRDELLLTCERVADWLDANGKDEDQSFGVRIAILIGRGLACPKCGSTAVHGCGHDWHIARRPVPH
jgi:hypothetical protein